MGGAKRLLEEQQADYDAGVAACAETGALEECEYHPGTFYEGPEAEDGLRIALENASTDEERAAIQSAYDDNSGIDYCSSCDNNMRD